MRNNIFTGAAMALIVIGLLLLVFCLGARFAQPTYGPQTAVDTSANIGMSPTIRVVETHTVEYIEKPVTEVKYIDRFKSVPVELRNFSSLEELKQWLKDRKNVTTVRFQSPDTNIDCDDYALEMQQKALTDGYTMSFQIIESDKYNSLFKSSKLPPNTLHAINLAVIANNAYYIEPQTDEIAFAAHLD